MPALPFAKSSKFVLEKVDFLLWKKNPINSWTSKQYGVKSLPNVFT